MYLSEKLPETGKHGVITSYSIHYTKLYDIRDTLDLNLNIFSVTSGVSSHPYTFQIAGSRVLEWRFDNILLVDSTTNEPDSHGFVSFTVNQNPDLPYGTQILNKAVITSYSIHYTKLYEMITIFP